MAVVVNSEHRQCPGDTRFTLRIVREIAAGHVATAVVKIYTSIYSIETHGPPVDERKESALELELIQTQMAQKPMLRAEVGMRVRCANKASAE